MVGGWAFLLLTSERERLLTAMTIVIDSKEVDGLSCSLPLLYSLSAGIVMVIDRGLIDNSVSPFTWLAKIERHSFSQAIQALNKLVSLGN